MHSNPHRRVGVPGHHHSGPDDMGDYQMRDKLAIHMSRVAGNPLGQHRQMFMAYLICSGVRSVHSRFLGFLASASWAFVGRPIFLGCSKQTRLPSPVSSSIASLSSPSSAATCLSLSVACLSSYSDQFNSTLLNLWIPKCAEVLLRSFRTVEGLRLDLRCVS